MVITIDGPAGSGKSTVAHKLAMRLGLIHLNSGALFRAVGLEARKRNVPLDDDAAVALLARELRFRFELGEDSETTLFVDGADLSSELSGEEAGALASKVAVLPAVRACLLEVQREVAKAHSLVVEGRDSGTDVFPDAENKFYLSAGIDVRADRRLKEILSREQISGKSSAQILDEHGWKDEDAARKAILEQVAGRDSRDAEREAAPHRKAEDAVEIDTSTLTADEVIELIAARLSK